MKALFLFALLFITTKNFSQIRLGSVYVKTERNFSEEKTNTRSTYVKAFANNIPTAVINDFSARYPGVEKISWYVNDKDVSGYFNNNDQQVTISYKKDGLFLYERKTYDGSKLNQLARDFLERETGFSFVISQVTH